MVVLFFSLLGGWALAVINFYLANQTLLNTLLVAYGLLLGLSHYTMSSVERFLFTCLKTEDGGAVLRALRRCGRHGARAERQGEVPVSLYLIGGGLRLPCRTQELVDPPPGKEIQGSPCRNCGLA